MTDNNKNIVNSTRFCKNCSAEVSGYTFCPVCGQKSDTHVLTFRELLEEIADGLFNMDSRIWRSLIPLALKPGKLTLEYLKGRRMYYLPPFRLYLILSVLFFLVSADLTFDEEAGVITDQLANNAAEIPTGEAPDETSQEAAGTETTTPSAGAPGEEDFGTQFSRELQEELVQEFGLSFEEEFIDREGQDQPGDFCINNNLFTGETAKAVFRALCLQFVQDADPIIRDLIDSIPVMMIIGIPLVALVMQGLYLFSGRYYVEHIIFLLHVHAFYFLVSIATSLSSSVGQRVDLLFTPMDWFRIIAGLYIPLYIFLAMRRVYGDGKFKTALKAFVLMIGYIFCVITVGVGGLIFAALARTV